MSGRQTVRIRGTPNEKQAQFFASRARYTAYGGARGGGKSWALRRKLVSMGFARERRAGRSAENRIRGMAMHTSTDEMSDARES